MGRFCLNKFDGIVYINLTGREDRKQTLLEEIKRAGVDEEQIYRIEAVYDPYFGMRGCAKSHILAIEYAKEQGFENVLILEDDCYFKQSPERVDRMIDRFFSEVKEWDVFLLGTHVIDYESTEWKGINRVLLAIAAHAYCINCHYYDELLKLLRICVLNMGDAVFPHNAVPHDLSWNNLIMRDRWYCLDIVLHQRPGYSDIELEHRVREHPERLNG